MKYLGLAASTSAAFLATVVPLPPFSCACVTFPFSTDSLEGSALSSKSHLASQAFDVATML